MSYAAPVVSKYSQKVILVAHIGLNCILVSMKELSM